MSSPGHNKVSNTVRLNVGGKEYQVSRSLFQQKRYESSMLARMVSNTWLKDNKTLSIDRDGELFRHVLNFLRYGNVTLPVHSSISTEELSREFDFYGIEVEEGSGRFLAPLSSVPTMASMKAQRTEVAELRSRLEEIGSSYRLPFALRLDLVRAEQLALVQMFRPEDDVEVPHLLHKFVYTVDIPVTSDGLMIDVGNLFGSAAFFLGYRRSNNDEKGPAESANLVENTGDVVYSIDGATTACMPFESVAGMLRRLVKSGKTSIRVTFLRYACLDRAIQYLKKDVERLSRLVESRKRNYRRKELEREYLQRCISECEAKKQKREALE